MKEVVIQEIMQLKMIGETRILPCSTNVVLYCLASGFCSKATLKKVADTPAEIIKITGMLKGGFSEPEARYLADSMCTYNTLLRHNGVPTPDIESCEIYQNCPGQYVIVTSSPYMGMKDIGLCNLEVIIQKANNFGDIEPYLRGVIGIFNKLFEQRIGLLLREIGLDPKPANFVINDRGEISFVDIFPARYFQAWNLAKSYHRNPWFRDGKLAIVEWPLPKTELGFQLGHWKHFTIPGILTIFLSQLSRIRPEWRLQFENLIIQSFDCMPEIADYFENAPWKKMRNALQRDDQASMMQLIDQFEGEHIYFMREVASELALAGRMSTHHLEEFFHASHFEDELPYEQVWDLKSRLFNVCGVT